MLTLKPRSTRAYLCKNIFETNRFSLFLYSIIPGQQERLMSEYLGNWKGWKYLYTTSSVAK